ncbi:MULTISPECIES: hexitol phosphatase HxpB [Citrobacter]|uniref:Hexitol phosphatase HxpB n=1 Tax=Citrobacter sedlakii TaxID=67826 RepID=A0ABS0ZL88_9ENTR|nr:MULTISPECIES: hexitol phosphatase HxpB [Citrobacter]EHG7582773.1 hexitol phosphatase HxpB [Citrobacter sedlakii]EHG7612970.1 hexitol phosphatase HxpB [Citrobacter sedlakii]EIQ7159312.1 hexitol phosphatase HxpB [Citrobacter sedlakii]EKJ8220034.1 hexitol phosphatase HxpB [Citrobacter sedlakii]MBJ8379494.1 hexitol phosphatase HxpB [Citrobacter sedlakii]
MTIPRQILAAIFDMDGLLINSEPLWDRAELDVLASVGVDITRRHELPDTLGLRIDMVVDLWFAQQPWNGPSRQEVTERIIRRAITLVEETRPLLPGVKEAVALCKEQGLLVGLASASPLHMLEKVLTMFDLRDSFDALASAEKLPYSKPHPQVYLDCAAKLGVDPLTCVALEDSVNGMVASKAARMRSIVVPAKEDQHDPRFALANVKLTSLTELTAADLRG